MDTFNSFADDINKKFSNIDKNRDFYENYQNCENCENDYKSETCQKCKKYEEYVEQENKRIIFEYVFYIVIGTVLLLYILFPDKMNELFNNILSSFKVNNKENSKTVTFLYSIVFLTLLFSLLLTAINAWSLKSYNILLVYMIVIIAIIIYSTKVCFTDKKEETHSNFNKEVMRHFRFY